MEEIERKFDTYEQRGLKREVIGTVDLSGEQLAQINRWGKNYVEARKNLVEIVSGCNLR